MLYKSDFVIQPNNIPIVNNAFSINLNSNKEIRKTSVYSIAYSFKPVSYFSSVFALNTIKYCDGGVNVVGAFDKIYGLLVILLYTISVVLVTPLSKQQIGADLPLTVLDITFTVFQTIEIVYDIFIVTFCNSVYFVHLIKIIDDIDNHFSNAKSIFFKRRRFSILLLFFPCIIVFMTILFKNLELLEVLTYVTFLFIMTQGINCVFFLLIIYTQLLHFNFIMLSKASDMSAPKKLIFKDDITAHFMKKMLKNSTNMISNNSYCWFELMQIYDKISDCIYLFNQIYNQQILLMFNSWLLSTVLAICKYISPTLKNSDSFTTNIFYYLLTNLRPFFITKMSETIIQERRKALLALEHILVHQSLDEDYRSQIEITLKLMESRTMKISAKVCSVNLRTMFTFAGRIISLTVLMIQLFYLDN